MGTFAKAQGPIDLFTVTFEAGAATIAENMIVELGSNQFEVVKCANSNSKNVLGVSTKTGVSTIATGNPVPVRMLGIATVIADDGSIAAGDFLKSGTTTKDRVTSITAATSQQHIIGRALQASNAAGDSITMFLMNIPGAIVS